MALRGQVASIDMLHLPLLTLNLVLVSWHCQLLYAPVCTSSECASAPGDI